MIPFKIIFILNEKTNDQLLFESMEKPVKGEIFSIQDADGKLWEAKITDVTKFVVRSKDKSASLEYRCKVEKHEADKHVIGFGKR
jgi:hypothetical protein